MSDYDDYDADYGNDYQPQIEQPQQEQEQDIEAVLEVDFFNAEGLIRQNKYNEAISALKDIYKTADEHNIKGYKMKVQNQLLHIYVQNKNFNELKDTLKNISELSEKENFTENTLRSIIQILQTLERKLYESYWTELIFLIEKQDGAGKLKSYLIMLKKELAEKSEKSEVLYKKVKETIQQNQVPIGSLIEVYSLQIKYHKLKNLPMENLLKKIQLNIPLLEDETMTNDTSLSEIKEAVAEVLYDEGSYKDCAVYLCDSFSENAKFGKNTESIKALLKLNILVLLLCKDKELLQKKSFNPLLHESTANFKMDQDIQALFGLVEAFNALEFVRFSEIYKIIDTGSFQKPYTDIYERVIMQLKKQKLLYIVRPYRTVTFDYLSKRLSESGERVSAMIFDLIVEKKINGAIHMKEQFLEVLPQQNYYFTIQMSNLKQLAQRL